MTIDVDELESSVASVLAAIAKHGTKDTLPIDAENLLRDLEEKVGEFLDAVPFEEGVDEAVVDEDEPPPPKGPKLRLVGRSVSS